MLTAVLLLVPRGPASGGPLANPGSYGYSVVVKPGGSFVDAFNIIRATGSRSRGATAKLIAVQADYASILRHHLVGRPVEGVDVEAVAGLTAGFSGADLAHVCEAAAEQALMRSVRSGVVGPVLQQDLRAAVGETAPSVGAWLEVAKNVVRFGRDDGTHAELREYLRARSLR